MKEFENIGNAIVKLRKKRNLTQESLIEKIGDEKLSLTTLKRIERGNLGNFKNLLVIADALDVSVSDIIPDSLLSYLENEEWNEDDIEYKIWIKNTLYPRESSFWKQHYPITTLIQFLLYLPLMNRVDLVDSLNRIDGEILGREDYILFQLKYLYDAIPDSPEKRYADYQAHKINERYFEDCIINEERTEEYERVAYKEEEYKAYSNWLSSLKQEITYPNFSVNKHHNLMFIGLEEKSKTRKLNGSEEFILEEMLIDDIARCCERIQADNSIKNSMEDEINDRLRDLLDRSRFMDIRDQTRQGSSSTGKCAGEVDIMIIKDKTPMSIIETMKLSCVDKKYISEHIDKIYKYDTLGYRYNFIVAYVVDTKDFNEFCERYKEFVCLYKYPYEMIECRIDEKLQYPEMRVIEVKLNRQGVSTKLYNILVHMPK